MCDYLPNKGETYKYCTYTSKNQKKHWDKLERNEIEAYEKFVTILVTSNSHPDEMLIEHQAFTSHRKEPFIFEEKMKLRKGKIIMEMASSPEGAIVLKLPIKLKNKWDVEGWEIKATRGSKEEAFKIKC